MFNFLKFYKTKEYFHLATHTLATAGLAIGAVVIGEPWAIIAGTASTALLTNRQEKRISLFRDRARKVARTTSAFS